MTTETQPADLLAHLLALVAKWHEQASRSSIGGDHMDAVEGQTLQLCADELQDAIASLAAHRGEVACWLSIDSMPTDDTFILARAEDQRPAMVWRASILARNLAGPTPDHLRYPATKWMPIPGDSATSNDTYPLHYGELWELARELTSNLSPGLPLNSRARHAAKKIRAVISAHPPQAQAGAGDGVALIAVERRRQVEVEGWTPGHDDAHDSEEMSLAAACYAIPFAERLFDYHRGAPVSWPWDAEWWKPGDRIRELVKAGALIAAEIDRLQRAALEAKP